MDQLNDPFSLSIHSEELFTLVNPLDTPQRYAINRLGRAHLCKLRDVKIALTWQLKMMDLVSVGDKEDITIVVYLKELWPGRVCIRIR